MIRHHRKDGSATAVASTVGGPEPDAAIVAVMSGVADAYRHEANGVEVACYVLEALEAAGYQVAPVPR